MKEFVNLAILKAENPEAYKKLASTGIMVGHTVKIAGQENRPDIGLPYHMTVKFFNPEKDSPEAIHDVARQLKFTPPDPKQTQIEPSMFKDRLGNDVYVLKLHGPHADEIKEHNKKFSHMGYPTTYEFSPHISVDKKTWDKIVASKAKTAHEAGIEFGPAQLRSGHNVLATYPHVPGKKAPTYAPAAKEKQPTKLAASEAEYGEPLEKGAMKTAATALGIAAGMAVATPTPNAIPTTVIHPTYSSDTMLQAISDVESTGGKFVNHRMLNGIHEGEKAYGKYALTPNVIRETINMHRDLKGKHRKAIGLSGSDLHHYMQDNPGLEDEIARRHLNRLEHHFGQDPVAIGHAWLNGITGTHKAKKANENINDHWHVKKIKQAYLKRI